MAGRQKQDRGRVNKDDGCTEEETDCGKCEKEVKETDCALECEVCDVWFHIECEGIPKAVYKFILEKEAGEQLSWHCSFCKRGCVKLNKRIKKLDEQHKDMINKHQALTVIVEDLKDCVGVNREKQTDLNNRVGRLEAQSVKVNDVVEKNCVDAQELANRLGTLEAKVINLEDKLESQKAQWPRLETNKMDTRQQQSSQEQMEPDTVISEIYDRKRRENNLVMYGVAKSKSSVTTERIEHDRKWAVDFMRACGISAEDKIYEAYRIGGIRPDKPRPMRLKFTDIKPKIDIFRNLKNLKGNEAYSSVRVANDLTKKEREHEATLRQEAKNLVAAGKGQYRVTGPPWRRITKVGEAAQTRIAGPMPMARQEQSQVEHQPTREEVVQEPNGQVESANQEISAQADQVE